MKKKIFILCSIILLIPYIYKILIKRNARKNPINLAFFTPNGSHVNIRTIIKEPGK